MTLKCPNCGYDNESGAASCRMCQFAFIREQLNTSTSQAVNTSSGPEQAVVSSLGQEFYEGIYKLRFLILILVLVVFCLYFIIVG